MKDKDYEVLLMTDPIDEWVVQALTEYEKKPLVSAEKGDLKIDDKKEEEKAKELNSLFEFIKTELTDKVKEVRASTRLKDSVACLSSDEGEMSAYMEKIMKATGNAGPDAKRVLELNADHPAITKMKELFEKDKKDMRLKDYSQLLFDMAVIGEGGKIENPSQFQQTGGGTADRRHLNPQHSFPFKKRSSFFNLKTAAFFWWGAGMGMGLNCIFDTWG